LVTGEGCGEVVMTGVRLWIELEVRRDEMRWIGGG